MGKQTQQLKDENGNVVLESTVQTDELPPEEAILQSPGNSGLSQPPIDHEKVIGAARNLDGSPFTSEQVAAIKLCIKRFEEFREELREINEGKAAAKAALTEVCPNLDIKTFMIVYNIYIAVDAEQEAGDQMAHVAATMKDLSTLWAQPTLFDA